MWLETVILANSQYIKLKEGEEVKTMTVRYRTCGDMPITGAVESTADTLQQVIDEVSTTRTTERGGRADDKRAETAMEDRKTRILLNYGKTKYRIITIYNSL